MPTIRNIIAKAGTITKTSQDLFKKVSLVSKFITYHKTKTYIKSVISKQRKNNSDKNLS
ncbi:MAG TPA: hypothetical protein VH796_02745 [Nitrososphaeraceae archaeon]|jgi:hypothetical protein